MLARSAYAAMVLARIAYLGGMPPRLAAMPDLPEQIMLAAVGAWAGTTLTGTTLAQTVNDLLDEAKRVESRQQWRSFAATKVNQQFADQSLPCFGTLELFGDQYCSTLYTDTTDDDLRSVTSRKSSIPETGSCSPSFSAMSLPKTQPDTACGWARILETIGPECAEWNMQTALLFFYGSDGNGGIFLNYDLDPDRQDDSGMVEVDNGYIWITPLKVHRSFARRACRSAPASRNACRDSARLRRLPSVVCWAGEPTPTTCCPVQPKR